MPALRHVFRASISILLLLACNQDRVVSPTGSVRTITPRPTGNSSHPKESPDGFSAPFINRDTATGKTRTDALFGFRVKWTTRYKVTINDEANQISNGYPLPEIQPVPLNGVISWRTATNLLRTANFSDDGDGPAVVYVTMAINDTMLGINVSGLPGASSISRTGTDTNGVPFWCGPDYSRPPCYRYEGSPGSATFERLNAEVELTADSTQAGQGSMVSFLLKSVPGVVEGQVMSVDIDKTSWIPDDDSLGGDYTTAQASGACPWDNVASNYRQCSRGINSSGTLKVVGGVNGKYFEKSWHITRTDAYPILTATKYFVNAGQLDTFTVRMSDGSAFTTPSPAWSWVADSGVAASAVNCKTANPCPGRINESGWVRVRVAHNYVFKHTKVHITVGPPPELEVTPTEATVLLGEQIEFGTSAVGAPYSIGGWTFAGTPIAACGTSKQCLFIPPHSGRLAVHGIVDQRPDTAFATLTVRLDSLDRGLNGVSVDSNAVSVLTINNEGGVESTPHPGKYVFPKDTVVALAIVPDTGFMAAVTVLDDSMTANIRTIAMNRSHVVAAAARPDYLADPAVAGMAARFNALLNSDLNKRASYAALLQHYISIRRSAGAEIADSIFAIGNLMGIDPFRSDSAAMRALDEILAGTVFYVIDREDSTIVRFEAPPLVTLRAAPPQSVAHDVLQGGKRIRIGFVNGIKNTELDAETNAGLLREIVRQFHIPHGAAEDTLVELFYNPDYATQRATWTPPIMCALAQVRAVKYIGGLNALAAFAACKGQQLVRSVTQRDLVEAHIQRNALLDNLPPPNTFGVERIADRIDTLHRDSVSIIFVAHSQGTMMVQNALVKLQQRHNRPANTDSRCVALLALASPVPKSAFETVLDADHLRTLTARRDILEYGRTIDQSIDHFDSVNTLKADTIVAVLAAEMANPTGAEIAWSQKVHEVGSNYFRDQFGSVLVKNHLVDLVDECVNTP